MRASNDSRDTTALPRTGIFMLLGAVTRWVYWAPIVLESRAIEIGLKLGGMSDAPAWIQERLRSAKGVKSCGPIVTWMLWPGVIMRVTVSLSSFAFLWRSVATALSHLDGGKDERDKSTASQDEFPAEFFVLSILAALITSVGFQLWLFGIGWSRATLGVLLTLVLAIVAGACVGRNGYYARRTHGQSHPTHFWRH